MKNSIMFGSVMESKIERERKYGMGKTTKVRGSLGHSNGGQDILKSEYSAVSHTLQM